MTDIDSCETDYLVYEHAEQALALAVDKHYDDLSHIERVVHHRLNKMIGDRTIDTPPTVGDYVGIVLQSRWEQHFELGKTYSPREIVDMVSSVIP